jgi:hypothetical protein
VQLSLMLLELLCLGFIHFLALVPGLGSENLVPYNDALGRDVFWLGIRFLGFGSFLRLGGLELTGFEKCVSEFVNRADNIPALTSSSSSSKITSCTFFVPSVSKIPVS